MKSLLFLPFVAILGVSCAPSTPTSRIEKNPTMYDLLPSSHQDLVDQGRIKQGMSKEAVFLAWGNPEIKSDGEEDDVRFERWIYTRLTPIYTNSFDGYYGYGGYYPSYSGYGRRRGYGYGYNSGVAYIKSKAASVDFKNDRVSRWQRGRLSD